MTTRAAGTSSVRFVPSRVEGVEGVVSEVEVFSDRVALRVGERWRELRFEEIWKGREAGRTGLFGALRPPRIVGDVYYIRAKYSDSFVRFHTLPRTVVYMPTDGPATYPRSVFWRLQEVVRGGGYALKDYDPARPEEPHIARWRRIIGAAVTLLCFLNFVFLAGRSIYHGGSYANGKVVDGRYYVGTRGRLREVSWETYDSMRLHERSILVTMPLMFVGMVVWQGWPRRRRNT